MAAKRVPDMPNNKGGNYGRRHNIKRMPEAPGKRGENGKPSGQIPVERRGNVGTRMNIHEQTPSRRRSANEAKKIDPNTPEIRRGAKRAQEYKIKKKKKGVNRLAIVYSVIFTLVFLAVSGVLSLAFYLNLIKTDPPAYDRLKLKMCLEHEVKTVKAISVDVDKYVRNDVLYVNMTAISEKFGFVMTGNHKALRFITDFETGESVYFEIGTPCAEINGTEVRLSGESFKADEDLFIPADFFSEYVTGIEITLDEEEKTLMILRNTARNEAGHFDEAEVEFKLKEIADCDSISEMDLPKEIADKCYFPTVFPDTSMQY